MAYIKTLKDNELIGGTDNTDVYPVSTTQAIFSQKPDGTMPDGIKHQRLEERLFDGEEDCRELHRKTEMLVVYINNDKANQTLEITGDTKQMILTGYAQLETYGDEPAEPVAFDKMTVKKLTISSGSAIIVEKNNWEGTETFDIPNQVGQYKARFDVTYNNVSKFAETITNMNLRKYFGFSDSQPTNVETLATSNFSNSVACTVTIPASGEGFKHIYFAVPSGMTITRVVQPDALNAPLAFHQIGTTERNINGTNFTYKLYESGTTTTSEDGYIDASVSKRLTIS